MVPRGQMIEIIDLSYHSENNLRVNTMDNFPKANQDKIKLRQLLYHSYFMF